MVRAPPGYAILGTDVNSEDLESDGGRTVWSLLTETVLRHLGGSRSRAPAILALSRDHAKVFNYSRLPLLLQANADMLPE